MKTNITITFPETTLKTENLAAGVATVLSAPSGPETEFRIGPFRATARAAPLRVATFDGTVPLTPSRRIEVIVHVGEPDTDRGGNNIGGGSFTGHGASVAECLRDILGQRGCRRTRLRLASVQDAIRACPWGLCVSRDYAGELRDRVQGEQS